MFRHLIDWLNHNEGAALGLLALASALVSAVLVIITWWQASLSRKALALSLQAEKSRVRPYVIFEIVYEDLIANAMVRNIGVSPALNVRVAVTPELRFDKHERMIAFIEHGVAFLGPGRKVYEPLGTYELLYKNYAEFKFSGEVIYTDAENTAYREKFFIDLTYLKFAGMINPDKEVDKLGNIEKELEGIGDTLRKPMLVRYISEPEYQRQETARREERDKRHQAFLASQAAQQAAVAPKVAPTKSTGTPPKATQP